MRFDLLDWVLDVDVPLTMELSSSQASDHCQCGYCRNYYAALDASLPTLRPFLSRFGINAEAPDELCPFEPTIYEATYVIQGNILEKGTQNLLIDGVPLEILDAQEADIHTEHPMPYFTLRIGLMELPWLLDEPQSNVVSPANDPGYIERMERKLLRRLPPKTFDT